jgi:hypothetical protein
MRHTQMYTKALKEEPSKDGDYHTYPPGKYPRHYKLCVIITRVLTVNYDFCAIQIGFDGLTFGGNACTIDCLLLVDAP